MMHGGTGPVWLSALDKHWAMQLHSRFWTLRLMEFDGGSEMASSGKLSS